MNQIRYSVSIILCLAFASASAFASVTFIGSSGDHQASLEFTMVGAELRITLRNTSAMDALYPTDMLGGVFFDIANNVLLTPIRADLDPSSCFLYADPQTGYCTVPSDSNIGGEWAYHQFTSGSPISQHYGIGAVGFGFFDGVADRFDTSQNIAGPIAIDGGDFSLAPHGDDPTTGNGGLTGRTYIRYGAVFAFTPPAGFELAAAAIRNVRFQYGTDFAEQPIPEPATLALIGGGLIGLGLWRRRSAR